jgi:hypothetical protein
MPLRSNRRCESSWTRSLPLYCWLCYRRERDHFIEGVATVATSTTLSVGALFVAGSRGTIGL